MAYSQSELDSIYGELDGLQDSFPEEVLANYALPSLRDNYHEILDQLNSLFESKEYDKFRVSETDFGDTERLIFKSRLTMLLKKIQSSVSEKYLNKMAMLRKSGGLNINNNNSQNQEQTTNIEISITLEQKLKKLIEKHKEGSKERNFLKTILDYWQGAKDIIGFVKFLYKTAERFELPIHEALGLFIK